MSAPNTVTFSGELLEKMKREGSLTKEQLDFLRCEAEKHLNDTTVYSVVYRNTKPPTNNPHEYASMGPYWWPNPDTEDGLPYVRRDGEVNPACAEKMAYYAMAIAAFTLSLAAYYFDEKKYAEKAEKIIYDWYLNPETYMEPHAEYAQFIPGICNGRGIGIIEFIHSHRVFNAIAMLESVGYISESTVSGVKEWFVKFANWMITSENGLDEDLQLNNHGTIYDANVLATAIFTGRKFLAEKICKTAYARRFLSQVEPDGSQPLELARTRAMNYSIDNAQGLILIA
ncbi:MAG: alginate lyase family protein, partial [Clostridia bacterium]|nr:alginate lyase family protein [Clostridia bacterium]